MSAAFFRGTQIDQNVKFKDKDKQLIRDTEWPSSFDKPVDLKKVEIDVIKKWMEQRLPELMGFEDEVVLVYAHAQLEECATNIDMPYCPKRMQINMTGFVGDAVGPFMEELQDLLLTAQEDPRGIPPALVKEKQSEKEKMQNAIEEAKRKIARLKQLSGQAPAQVERKQEPEAEDRPQRSSRPEPPRKRYRSRSASSEADRDRRDRHRSSRKRRRSRSRSQRSDSSRSRSDDSRRRSKRRHRDSRHRRDRERDRDTDRRRKDRRRRRSHSRSSESDRGHSRHRRRDESEDSRNRHRKSKR